MYGQTKLSKPLHAMYCWVIQLIKLRLIKQSRTRPEGRISAGDSRSDGRPMIGGFILNGILGLDDCPVRLN